MALPNSTYQFILMDGITTVGDLIDFDEATFKQVAENLRRPPGRMPDPTIGQVGGAPIGSTIAIPPFVFGAKSQARLMVAADLVRFYDTIGRDPTANCLRWEPVMRNFGQQWKASKEAKEETQPDVPTIGNKSSLSVIRWIEAFRDHTLRCYGARNIPLLYVIRENVNVPAICPARAQDQPYTEEHGSIIDDLVARASHTHGLFRQDNSSLYFMLEVATRGTNYSDSIKPFTMARDGRAAFLAIVAQYAGKDKWDAEIKKHDLMLHTRKWKSNQNFTLEKFVALHRSAWMSLQNCAAHVEVQLPTQYTRVGYILDAIETSDAELQAAMANVKSDTVVGGKRGDFEAAVAYLLPADPVAKSKVAAQQSGKRAQAEISDTTTAEVSDFGSKASIGKTGVHLRYYKPDEYNKLNKAQKQELREWRAANPDKVTGAKKSGEPSSKKHKAMVATLKKMEKLAAQVKIAEKEQQQEECIQKVVTRMIGLDQGEAATTAGVAAGAAGIGSTGISAKQKNILKGILKNGKKTA